MQDSYQPRNISQNKDDRQGLELPSLQGLGTDLEQRIDRRQRRWLTELHTPGDSIPAHNIWGFPGGSDGKDPPHPFEAFPDHFGPPDLLWVPLWICMHYPTDTPVILEGLQMHLFS